MDHDSSDPRGGSPSHPPHLDRILAELCRGVENAAPDEMLQVLSQALDAFAREDDAESPQLILDFVLDSLRSGARPGQGTQRLARQLEARKRDFRWLGFVRDLLRAGSRPAWFVARGDLAEALRTGVVPPPPGDPGLQGYYRSVERSWRKELRDTGAASITAWPITLEELRRGVTEVQGTRGTLQHVGTVAMRNAHLDGVTPVYWPQRGGARCWCASGAAYGSCCGRPEDDGSADWPEGG